MFENSKRPFFSIIIPLYKTEPYLEQCLNSIKNQTFSNYECIIINDESTGVSLEEKDLWHRKDYKNKIENLDNIEKGRQAEHIIDQYDERFKMYKKANHGQGQAQNFALTKIKGKHLVIIDSDDFVDKNFLELAYNFLSDNKGKKICHNKWKSYQEGKIIEMKKIQNYVPKINSLKENLLFPSSIGTGINYFWEVDLIKKNNIKFRYNKIAYDSCFFFDCILAYYKKYKNIKFEELKTNYYYRQRPGQISRENETQLKTVRHLRIAMGDLKNKFFKIGILYGILAYLFYFRFFLYEKRTYYKGFLFFCLNTLAKTATLVSYFLVKTSNIFSF